MHCVTRLIPLILLSLPISFSVQGSDLIELRQLKHEVVQGHAERYPEFWSKLFEFAKHREFVLDAPEIEFLFSLIELADYGPSFPRELHSQAQNGLYLLGRANSAGNPMTRQLIAAELAIALVATRAGWERSEQARLLGVLTARIYWPGSRQPAVFRDALMKMLQSSDLMMSMSVANAIPNVTALEQEDIALARAYYGAVQRKWFRDKAQELELKQQAAFKQLARFREEREVASRYVSRMPKLVGGWDSFLQEVVQVRDVKILLEAGEELRALARVFEEKYIPGVADSASRPDYYRSLARQADGLIVEISGCGKVLSPS